MNTVAKLTQKQIEKTCSGDPDVSPGTRYVEWTLRFISTENALTYDKAVSFITMIGLSDCEKMRTKKIF